MIRPLIRSLIRPQTLGLLILLQATAAQALPELVVLLRHGHKDHPSDQQPNNYNLSAIGQRQALKLGQWLPRCLGVRPEKLRLASYGLDFETGKNARSYQTLVPLAVATANNIRMFDDAPQRSEAIGQALLSDPAYAGRSLVIAWEHRHLPELARGLGWQSMPAIDDNDFDSLWLLTFQANEASPTVRVLSQGRLLAACSKAAIR